MGAGDPQIAGLSCRGLAVAPGGRVVLRSLDLDVPAGTRTVVVGPSGAGKTTLLRAVAGLELPLSGEIRLAGRRLERVPAHRRRVAVVFQEPRLLPHLDVLENTAFPLRAAGVRRAERHARARALLEEVGLAALAGRPTRGLSGGEQQRVALARALCAEPLLLMLDEPLAAVDPNRREELRRLIAELQTARGLTMLYVTHDRTEAAELGERVALMIEGRVVQHDVPQALFERPASSTVARFFGSSNVIRAAVSGGQMRLAGVEVEAPGPDGEAVLTIRPERVRLEDDSPLRMRVLEAAYGGSHVRLRLRRGVLALEAQVPPEQAPPAGAETGVELPARYLWRLPEAAAGGDPAPVP